MHWPLAKWPLAKSPLSKLAWSKLALSKWPLARVAVVERSMEPALLPGDWLLVWRGALTQRPVHVRPGQLVIARHPGDPRMLLVKRAARRVGDGWWLDSDNPAAGAVDSRSFGPVPVGSIFARVLLRYWPRGRR